MASIGSYCGLKHGSVSIILNMKMGIYWMYYQMQESGTCSTECENWYGSFTCIPPYGLKHGIVSIILNMKTGT